VADLSNLSQHHRRIAITLAGAPGLDQLVERLALQVLHREVGQPIGLAGVVDADHVRMRHRVRERDLAQESAHGRAALGEIAAQDLERDVLLEQPVAGQEHHAHRTTAESPLECVAIVDDRPLFPDADLARGLMLAATIRDRICRGSGDVCARRLASGRRAELGGLIGREHAKLHGSRTPVDGWICPLTAAGCPASQTGGERLLWVVRRPAAPGDP
jgi:hypothetical protein